MAVNARFYVSGINKRVVSGGVPMSDVTLVPVVRATDDNISWSQYTPSGNITMTVTTANAQQWFEQRLGQDIAITFDDATPLPDQSAAATAAQQRDLEMQAQRRQAQQAAAASAAQDKTTARSSGTRKR